MAPNPKLGFNRAGASVRPAPGVKDVGPCGSNRPIESHRYLVILCDASPLSLEPSPFVQYFWIYHIAGQKRCTQLSSRLWPANESTEGWPAGPVSSNYGEKSHRNWHILRHKLHPSHWFGKLSKLGHDGPRSQLKQITIPVHSSLCWQRRNHRYSISIWICPKNEQVDMEWHG